MINCMLEEVLDHIDDMIMVRVVYGGGVAEYDGCLAHDYCCAINQWVKGLTATDMFVADDGVQIWVDYKEV